MVNGEIKLKIGKYKGRKLKEVPSDYLEWCIRNKTLKGRALLYAKRATGYPKTKYRVTVEDAVRGDGTYIVEAYTKHDAIRACQRENGVQCTQSSCGTSFTVTKI